METDTRIAIVRSKPPAYDESSHSFHDLLLTRSNERRAASRRRGMERSPYWISWKESGPSLIQAVGKATIFASGVAVGVGMMLLKEGEPILGRPAKAIVLGVGAVALMRLYQLRDSSRIRPWVHAFRGWTGLV